MTQDEERWNPDRRNGSERLQRERPQREPQLQLRWCGSDAHRKRYARGWRFHQQRPMPSYRRWSTPYGAQVRVRDWKVLPCPPEGVVVNGRVNPSKKS